MTEPRAVHDQRTDFDYFCTLATRWNDNDVYGHVNNGVFYEFFDSAVNRFLIERGDLDIHNAAVIGVVVESMCRYRVPLAYPELVEVGVRANRVGSRSLEYGIGVFRQADPQAAAAGYFTHVFVQRESMQAVPIPDAIRTALKTLADPASRVHLKS